MIDNYVYTIGKYYGYPDCCIKWFAENRLDDIRPLTPQQAKVNGGTGFIPCPSCAETVTKKTLRTLLKGRQCPTRFPDDNGDPENKNWTVLGRMWNAALRNRKKNAIQHVLDNLEEFIDKYKYPFKSEWITAPGLEDLGKPKSDNKITFPNQL